LKLSRKRKKGNRMPGEKGDQSPSKGAAEKAAPTATQPAPVAGTAAQQATIRYVDRPDVMETFADAISGLVFDGQTLRIEFAVTRLDEVKPNSPISGRRYPACRLTLSPAAAVELINRMQQVGAALRQAATARAAGRPG
jgi:hypothetical protein